MSRCDGPLISCMAPVIAFKGLGMCMTGTCGAVFSEGPGGTVTFVGGFDTRLYFPLLASNPPQNASHRPGNDVLLDDEGQQRRVGHPSSKGQLQHFSPGSRAPTDPDPPNTGGANRPPCAPGAAGGPLHLPLQESCCRPRTDHVEYVAISSRDTGSLRRDVSTGGRLTETWQETPAWGEEEG